MWGFAHDCRVEQLKTVALCSALTGTSNFLPSMLVIPRELTPLLALHLKNLRVREI